MIHLCKTFVLSLHRRPDRFARISAQLRAMGLDFETYDALDGPALRLQTGVVSPLLKGPIPAGRLGSFLSRASLWRECLRRDLGDVLIIEDDAVLEPDFVVRAEAAIAQLPADWDLLNFGCDDWASDRAENVNALLYRPGRPALTQAVLYSARSFPKLVAGTRALRETADVQVSSLPDLKIYATRTWLARQFDWEDSESATSLLS